MEYWFLKTRDSCDVVLNEVTKLGILLLTGHGNEHDQGLKASGVPPHREFQYVCLPANFICGVVILYENKSTND